MEQSETTNLNHEQVRRCRIDPWHTVLLSPTKVFAQAQAAKVLGPLEGAQRVEVSQDSQSLIILDDFCVHFLLNPLPNKQKNDQVKW